MESPADFSFDEEDEEDCFNPETGELVLGDIVISVDKVMEQAEKYGHSRTREYAFLIAHSMLHLFGYDHMVPEEARVMEAEAGCHSGKPEYFTLGRISGMKQGYLKMTGILCLAIVFLMAAGCGKAKTQEAEENAFNTEAEVIAWEEEEQADNEDDAASEEPDKPAPREVVDGQDPKLLYRRMDRRGARKDQAPLRLC